MSNPFTEQDSSSRPTRRTLVARARSRDADAWDNLVRLYRPLVGYWCRAGGAPADDTEDYIQEVFLAASTALPGFRHDQPGDTFRGWLRGITKNVLRTGYRQRIRQPVGEGGTDAWLNLQAVSAATTGIPDDDPPEQEHQLYVRAMDLVRSEFEDRTWQMFWQSVVDERPAADIAATFSVSPAAVRKARSRVLYRLKQEVGDIVEIAEGPV